MTDKKQAWTKEPSTTMEVKDWRDLVIQCAVALELPGGVLYKKIPEEIK